MKRVILPKQFRKISLDDKCCSISKNLKPGIDYDGSIIDGAWVCSVCGKEWTGKGKDEYLNHELQTLTDFGKQFLNALTDVIKEGKHLNISIVVGRMAYKDMSGNKKYENTLGNTKKSSNSR